MSSGLSNVQLAVHVVSERFARGPRERVPEPMVMDDPDSVAAFHTADPVLQAPIYALNAEAMSRLLPDGGVVLDLGSGSAQLLAHLARSRPDVRIVGTDLSPTMVAAGRELLREQHLDDRVEVREADMTALPEDLVGHVDLVSTVWALHHLPTLDHLDRCLAQMASVRRRTGCAVWIFDFARLRRDATLPALMRIATSAPGRLLHDGIASERASWSPRELQEAIARSGLGHLEGGRERVLGHLQSYHAHAVTSTSSGHAMHFVPQPLTADGSRLVSRLRRSMPALPG